MIFVNENCWNGSGMLYHFRLCSLETARKERRNALLRNILKFSSSHLPQTFSNVSVSIIFASHCRLCICSACSSLNVNIVGLFYLPCSWPVEWELVRLYRMMCAYNAMEISSTMFPISDNLITWTKITQATKDPRSCFKMFFVPWKYLYRCFVLVELP